MPKSLGNPHTVTFDCWGTLIHERDPDLNRQRRVVALARAVEEAGTRVDETTAAAALSHAWARHMDFWRREVATGSSEMAWWSLTELGVRIPAVAAAVQSDFEAAALADDATMALAGARETLASLAERGIRRALICDTGFSPGWVIRRILERHGLLDLLEVQVFSDEVGVPKPARLMFETALEFLGAPVADAVHVGDLRRTDVAGARAAGMKTVRINGHHDDTSDHPEADFVVRSHADLRCILNGTR